MSPFFILLNQSGISQRKSDPVPPVTDEERKAALRSFGHDWDSRVRLSSNDDVLDDDLEVDEDDEGGEKRQLSLSPSFSSRQGSDESYDDDDLDEEEDDGDDEELPPCGRLDEDSIPTARAGHQSSISSIGASRGGSLSVSQVGRLVSWHA